MKVDSKKTLNILIVEEESVDIMFMQALLGKSSLPISKIESAKSLKDALEFLSKDHFDVALMDLNLPDSRGLDTLTSICEKFPLLPIVVITGEYGEDFGLKVIAMGAQEYLVKGMYNKLALIKSILYALERKKADHKLLMAEEKYRTIFENSAVAITVTDEQERLISWNKFTEDLLGMDKEDLYLTPVKSLYPESEWKRIRDCNIRQTGLQQHLRESRMIRKNGRVIDVDVSLNVIKSSDGRVTGYVGVFNDVTQRKQHQEIIDRKQKNLEAIFDAAPVGMLLIDENMIIKRVNDSIRRMLRTEYSQIIDRQIGHVLGCINALSNEQGCGCGQICSTCPLRETIKEVLDSHESVHEVEFHPELKVDNKEVHPWLSISAEPAVIDGSNCIVIAIDDITERKLAEEKLRETIELKSQFTSTVSHELRTPLACVKEAIAVVLDGATGRIKPKQRNFLDIAVRNIDRLALLINDILDFQRLEAGKIKLNIQENNINQVVEEVYNTMLSAASKENVEFSLELDGNMPRAKFDSDRMIQVLTNLVANAIKFILEKGRVSVSTESRAEEIVIRVSDTGMGIPKQSIPKIFDRFYRVQRPGKEIQGTGLGLAIVKKIVAQHGGRIELKSEMAQGTTFTVFLPLDAEAESQLAQSEMDEVLESSLA